MARNRPTRNHPGSGGFFGVALPRKIRGQVQTTLASVRAARLTATQTVDWAAYRATVKQARVTSKGLRAQVRAAGEAYVASIRAARHTFWSTIHALRGASSLPTDSGNPTPPPAPIVPSV